MANEFVIRISAEDKATATVNKIKEALSRVTDPVEKAQKRVGSLGDIGQVSLGKLTKGLNSVAHAARTVVDRIVSIIPGLTALGAAGSLAGIAALSDKFGNFGFGLNKSSKLLGMSAQDLAAWHVAAKRAGVSAEEFDSSMSSSQTAIRGAAFGTNPEAFLLMQRMGVQIQQNKDGTIDYYKTQMMLMKAIERQKNPVAQRAAAETFGYGALLPMLQQGTYEADKARAMRKGLVPTPEEIARAVEFHQNVNDLEDSVTGLGNSIGSSLIPVLDPLIQKLANWLDQHRIDIANKITEAVQKFSNWIQSINWDEVTAKAKEFWDAIGGVKGVAIAIAAITFAGPIGGVLNLTAALVTLTSTTIPAALTALGTLGLAGLAAWGALKVAKLAGLPDVDREQGINDIARDDWIAASTHLSAGDLIAAMLKRSTGVSNQQIVEGMRTSQGGVPPDGKTPMGIRNNNPLNMLDHGNEITYATPEQGIAAAVKNLRKGYRGLTIAQIADKWTGGARTGNTPEQMANYVGILSKGSGVGADQVPDLNQASVVASIIKAQIKAENGQQPYSNEQIAAGIAGRPTPEQPSPDPSDMSIVEIPAGGAAGPEESTKGQSGASATATTDDHSSRVAALQQHTVTFDFKNVPQGARVDAKAADGSYLPTKVNYAMGADMRGMP